MNDDVFNFLQFSLFRNDPEKQLFFYDKGFNMLFACHKVHDKLSPLFKNSLTPKSEEKIRVFTAEINKLVLGDNKIVILEFVDFKDRFDWLNTIVDLLSKDERNILLESYNITTMHLDSNKDKLSIRTLQYLDYSKFKFTSLKIEDIYKELAISENTSVLW